MLSHVVCFKFSEPGQAEEAARRLSAMRGRIPSLLDIEVGLDITRSARSHDLVLITRHADAAGMQAYQVHPVHQELLAWMKGVKPQAVAVDFLST